MATAHHHPQIASLLTLSARLGRDPLLVQASSGNTSVKLDGVLWIKASGKWLASAMDEDSLVPASLDQVRGCMRQGLDYRSIRAGTSGCELRASIETAMHAVMPHRVVVHVHSVNAIAWAVRRDAPERMAELLSGLPWQWIPYVASGLPLAQEIGRALERDPAATVFVLGNHGLVVGADTCAEAAALLDQVEQRIAVQPRPPRQAPVRLKPRAQWRLPANPALHALGADAVSFRILQQGVLYPCQAIFLQEPTGDAAYVAAAGRGVLVSASITKTQSAILGGLLEVVQRIDENAPIRYLLPSELEALLSADVYRYRQKVESNAKTRVV
ncbi:MAG TPA: class II aldolase [Solibacterales bacterium]|nr:class II aldolase [Bryobacterales bacterium]